MKKVMKKVTSLLVSALMAVSIFAMIPASAADKEVELIARNPNGDSTTVTISDGKAPECNFTYEGYTFWGWSSNQKLATVAYQPGDAIPDNTDKLYASWYIPCKYNIDDTTDDGGVVVDKYMSFWSGCPKNDGEFDTSNYLTYDGVTTTAETKDVFFGKEYPVIKYKSDDDVIDIDLYYTSLSNRGWGNRVLGEIPNQLPDDEYIGVWSEDNQQKTGVKGLFRKDAEGYYYYNSAETHAQYNSSTNGFILYDNLLMKSNNVPYNCRYGQFVPFNNYVKGSFENKDVDAYTYQCLTYQNELTVLNEGRPLYYKDICKFYFGMTVKANFIQKINGKMADGKDMVFEFNGDDEVYVYIDDILILDAGNTGYSNADINTINFATGAIYEKHRVNGDNSNYKTTKTTLFDRYKERSGYSDEQLAEIFELNEDGVTYRFKDLSSHTLKMYYADTGATVSRLNAKFSLDPIELDNSVAVSKNVKGDVNPAIVSDTSFQFKAIFDGVPAVAGTEYKILKNGVDTGTTGTIADGGLFYLKDGETAIIPYETAQEYEIAETGVLYSNSKLGKLILEYATTDVISGNGSSPISLTECNNGEGYTTGTISVEQNTLLFTNQCSQEGDYIPASLYIEKKMANGQAAPANATFDFEVKFGGSDKAYDGLYYINGEEFTATNGVITLKAGEKAEIKSIVLGTSYTVTEKSLTDGYNAPQYTNCESVIVAKGSTATIVNSLVNPPQPPVDPPVNPPVDPPVEPENPDTGVKFPVEWAIMMSMTSVGILLCISSKVVDRNKGNKENK